MLHRAFDAGLPASWVTADEIYGRDSQFRRLLEKRGIGYVVAVSCQQRLFLDGSYGRVDQHTQAFPKRHWKKLSCGVGSKGQRFYQWAFVPFGIPTNKGLIGATLVEESRRVGVLFYSCP
jgi:SRSO17 transposase